MAKQKAQFSFEISLSVLNHLGRNLYRSFMTVLGEAISNSWDADAKNVWIYIDKENNSFVVKDDGDGMTSDDFQDRFLRIGYSKRKNGSKSTKKRPYIGRKGIGKLALLSCAQRISVQTRKLDTEYVGGVIDNSGLNEAIKNDLKPDEYQLGNIDEALFQKYKKSHKHGTIIYFENMNEGIRNSTVYLKKLTALYFRFSLLDDGFNIYINDELITFEQLNDLANDTQFAWNINELRDPYLEKLADLPKLYKITLLPAEGTIRGFIGSVELPSQLKIKTTDEKVTVDLFVNGRLREKDILKHIPTTRLVESYLYGQIHFNELDDEEDRFASSREGVVADDPKYKAMLDQLREIIARIMKDWGELRNEVRDDGDPEDPRYTKREIKSRELFNVVSKDYSLPKKSGSKGKVDMWVDELASDAQFNFSSYAECFISENLMRKYIQEKKIPFSPVAQGEVAKLRSRESESKSAANINIDIRQNDNDLSYLDMTFLAKAVDPQRGVVNALDTDAKEYKPMRDALAHTALLTSQAKNKLTSVYDNMKGRVKTLLAAK